MQIHCRGSNGDKKWQRIIKFLPDRTINDALSTFEFSDKFAEWKNRNIRACAGRKTSRDWMTRFGNNIRTQAARPETKGSTPAQRKRVRR